MINREDILNEAYHKCMVEMYKWSQPSIDIDELITSGYKDDEKSPLYEQHYLSQDNFNYLREVYMNAYGITDEWDNTFNTLIKQLLNGGIEDNYIPRNGDTPGYRDYKNVAALKDVMSNPTDVDIVIEYIKKCQNFFKGHSLETNKFSCSVALGASPTCNSKAVEDYWHANNRPDFTIKEFRIDDVIYGGLNDEYVDTSEEEFIKTLK